MLDFGLAKALDPVSTAPVAEAATVSTLTEVGVVMGTAAYMSPEQARASRLTNAPTSGLVVQNFIEELKRRVRRSVP